MATPFPPTDLHAPLIPWTPAECHDVLARWATDGEAYRRRVRGACHAGRNARIWALYHDDGLTASEIGRLFDLTPWGIYAVIGRMRGATGDGPRARVMKPPTADYARLRARVLALRAGMQMTETEIMTALKMPRVLVAAILREGAA